MESQSLKLNITKGPRAGETLEFRRGAKVRVGRLVRGNNVAIKDAGISSKHISIDFDSDSGHWVLQDLASSNGTLLNDGIVSPGKPYVLSDADVVKIGESTSFSVELIDSSAAEPNLRANPRRRAAGRRGLEGGRVTEEIGELDVEDGLGKEESEKEVVVPAPVNPRRTRGRKKAEEKNLAVGSVSARASENQDGSECGEKSVEGRQTRAAARRGKQVKKTSGDRKDSTEVVNLGDEVANKEDLSLKHSEEKRQLASQNKGTENKRRQAGSRRRKKLDEDDKVVVSEDVGRLHTVEEAQEDEGEAKLSNLVEDRKFNGDSRDVGGIVDGPDPNLREGCSTVVDNTGINVEAGSKNTWGVDESTRKDGSLPHLTKITLREWFDFMEVYLPKQIEDETEKLIAEMRMKAERVKKYVAEQKANKSKEPVR